MSKFNHIAWGSTGSVRFQLRPNVLSRIELRRTSWKPVDMQARLIFDEVFDQFSLMDGVIVPYENNLTRNNPQQLFEKFYDLHASQRTSVRTDCQAQWFFGILRNKDCAKQIQALMVVQTGVNHRRLPTR